MYDQTANQILSYVYAYIKIYMLCTYMYDRNVPYNSPLHHPSWEGMGVARD